MMIETGVERVLKSKARVLGFMLVALIVLFLVLATGKPAQGRPSIGNTFTVNSTGDQADANLENSLCDVDLAVTGNQCTLRAAIEEANDTPNNTFNGTPINDVIRFNIAGSGVQTIQPLSALPQITEAVTIDGYTQPGTSKNTLEQGDDAVLLIELSGANAGSGANGLSIQASDSTVRGLGINRFGGSGVVITGAAATNNRVEGNVIGTDATRTQNGLGNRNGVLVTGGASGNTIGGTTPVARNFISENLVAGVELFGVVSANKVQGNFLGDPTGQLRSGNTFGLRMGGPSGGPFDTEIGGAMPGAGNVISRNGLGMFLDGAPEDTLIRGNLIGTDASGTQNRGNRSGGVIISGGSDNRIGGTAPGEANVIAFNGIGTSDGHGVEIRGGTGNAILSNSIFSNADLGINLSLDAFDEAVTSNDEDDPDTGANNLQNFPVLTSAINSGGSTAIKGTLNSIPDTDFTVQFFSNPPANFFGSEGQKFLGEITVLRTDIGGDASFTFTPTAAVPAGEIITATATNIGTGDTSEFSGGLAVNAPPTITSPRPTPNSTTTDRTPAIRAKVTDEQTELAKSNIKLFLDDQRNTAFSYAQDTDRLSFTPASDLSLGIHEVKIVATDEAGLKKTKTWSFTVVQP